MMQQPRAIISVPLSGRLRTMGVAAALVTLSLGICPVAAAADEALSTLITEASRRFDLPEPWLRSVIHAESGGNAQAVSPKGAIGLMQVMPDTFADLRTRYGLGADPFDPRDNILAGAAYLREMLDRFGEAGRRDRFLDVGRHDGRLAPVRRIGSRSLPRAGAGLKEFFTIAG